MQGMHGRYSKTEEILPVVVKLTGLLTPHPMDVPPRATAMMAEEKCDCHIVLFIDKLARRLLIDELPIKEAVAKLHCLAFKKFLSLLSLDSLGSSSSLLVISTKISCSVYSLYTCKKYTISSLSFLPIEALIWYHFIVNRQHED